MARVAARQTGKWRRSKAQKKGMEIKGKGEGLPRNAARAFILKSRWNKSAMRTWLKKRGKGKKAKGYVVFHPRKRILLPSSRN